MNKLLLTNEELQVAAAFVDAGVKSLGAVILKNPNVYSLYAKLEECASVKSKGKTNG